MRCIVEAAVSVQRGGYSWPTRVPRMLAAAFVAHEVYAGSPKFFQIILKKFTFFC